MLIFLSRLIYLYMFSTGEDILDVYNEIMPDQNYPFGGFQGNRSQNNPPVGGQAPQGGNLGTGEGESPLAQPPKFDMRTMASDISSMKSGEEQPKPYEPQAPTPNIPPMGGGMPPADMATMPINETKKEEPFTLPQVEDMTGKEEKIEPPIPPQNGAQPSQETKAETEQPTKETETKTASPMMKKGLFISVLSAIAVIGIAAMVYFFVWPKFFGGTTEEAAQAPVIETPTSEPTPEPEPTPEEQTTETTNDNEQATSELTETTTPTGETYVSILKTAADVTVESPLAEVSLTAMKALMQFNTATTPKLTEYPLKNPENKFVSINQILTAFLPSIFDETMNGNFDKGGLFSYTDDKGTWVAIVAQLKEGATLADVQNKISALESSGDLDNLFLVDSGEATTWKSGQAEGVSTRYLSYGLTGAGINYGWLDNKLVIAGSYGAFKEAVKRLR